MALYITKKPASIVYSDVEFFYNFTYTGVLATDKVEVRFIDAVNFSVLATVEYPCSGVFGGLVLRDAGRLLRHTLPLSLPTSTTLATRTAINECSVQHVKAFYLSYRIIHANGSAEPSTTTASTPNYLLKGGIADMSYINEHNRNMQAYSRAGFLPNGSPFLTHVPDNRYMTPQEAGWLLFLSDLTARPRAIYTVTYKDGSSSSFSRSFNVNAGTNYQWRTWYVPTGIDQCNLDPTGKGVWFWKVRVLTDTGGYPERTFYADYRPFHNGLQLYYRNSLGGIDHINLHGLIQRNGASFTKSEYRTDKRLAYNGATQFFGSEAVLKFKANTGFITAEHKTVLLDLFKTEFAALLLDGQWLPMKVPAQDMSAITSDDGLHSYSLEFETAGSFTSIPYQLVKLLHHNGGIVS